MSLILNIDTALGRASICLSKNGEPLQSAVLEDQKDQSGWLHVAIDRVLKKNNTGPRDLSAIAVSIGPGSYTGLRVGLAAAKGLCYALQLPLIAVGTLKMMALAAKEEAEDLICPLIDARRMEVFTALYDYSLWEKVSPHALIIDENSFTPILTSHKVLFCGNGIKKLQPLIKTANASFSESQTDATHLGILSAAGFRNQEFADIAYTGPLYIKEFHSNASSKS
ncbi:MAG TPA: tRNA (adenosine(37)-N6)-threonylcarbamoyltransferase complex dimerization subunit type 1 TsaB [Chitinophagaceae bacterium]|jgi:tRNA threonylcarbamoyladenosine biosynthesis protein TsaB|nr:tRNA (adenosine(37)-N6)-threonylcarbamoyltransferase complex dimerization subunit type 1 TsaB [Chitinophagaceae bacterium]